MKGGHFLGGSLGKCPRGHTTPHILSSIILAMAQIPLPLFLSRLLSPKFSRCITNPFLLAASNSLHYPPVPPQLVLGRRAFHETNFLPPPPIFDQSHASQATFGCLSARLLILAAGLSALGHGLSREPALCEQESTSSAELLITREHRQVPISFLDELKSALDEERIVVDPDERTFHARSLSSFHGVKNIPDVVVYPKSQDEVVAVVKACNTYKIPLVPYGGGTSVEGQILTPTGGVSIDMSLMKGIKSLHIEDMDVVVEPGIGWLELNEYLQPYGLFFPLDPGPGASIGGMCATRCSGSLAVRYGTMKDNVLSLKAVLGNGTVVKTANRARKSSAGYDLTRLMIGSEGTLGVITEVTLRLQKIPEASVVAICNFPSIKDAADVAIATMHCGIQVSRVELLDEVTMKALNHANGKNFPQKPTLMFEFVGTDAYAREQTLRVQKIAQDHHASGFEFFDTPERKEELWRMRKEALWACLSMVPDAEAMTSDVCVPLSRLAECISKSKEELDVSPLTCCIISHAGDGNFHTVILFDPSKADQAEEAMRLNALMVAAALSMEGTCTGEHGVGIGKLKYLEEELGMGTLKAMKMVKQALDPNNVMNPGKLIPPHVCL